MYIRITNDAYNAFQARAILRNLITSYAEFADLDEDDILDSYSDVLDDNLLLKGILENYDKIKDFLQLVKKLERYAEDTHEYSKLYEEVAKVHEELIYMEPGEDVIFSIDD